MTVLEVIQRSTEFLAKKGVDAARLQTELLLAHALELPRMQLYLNFERSLDALQSDRIRELVKRRGQREPLQYIVGSTSFCGLELKLDRNVLVPRPETELLAEQGWLFLQRLAAQTRSSPPAALDVATGSGCIVLALAAHCPSASLTATDISPAALSLARRNAETLGFGSRIQFAHSDLLSALDPKARFDLIISNPPYIPTAEIQTLQPEVRDFEPRNALDGGADGLDFYRSLAPQARTPLTSGGTLMVEFGDGQAEPLRKIFQEQNWIVEQVIEDYTRRPRILIASFHG